MGNTYMQKHMVLNTLRSVVTFSLLLTSACAIKPIGYTTVSPYAKPLEAKITHPLTIVLLSDVPDNVKVEGQGIKPMTVTEFRKSVQNGLQNVFAKNVTAVRLAEQKPDTGLVLLVYRVQPTWVLQGSTVRTMGYGTTSHPVTVPFIGTNFHYESTLYYQGKKIAAADGEALSEGAASRISQAPAIFGEGLKAMCEAINKTLLTDENTAKLR
jgi:hypothetical protein